MINERQQTIEDMGFERMLTMKDVRDILGVSYGIIYGLIRGDKLCAVKVTGEPVSRYEVDDTLLGLRFRPSDVRQFLQRQSVN